MSPLDPLNEIGYMPPPSNLEDQIQLTPTIFGAPFSLIMDEAVHIADSMYLHFFPS